VAASATKIIVASDLVFISPPEIESTYCGVSAKRTPWVKRFAIVIPRQVLGFHAKVLGYCSGCALAGRSQCRAVGAFSPEKMRLLPKSMTPVAQNPRSIGIACWCPEIFLTVQGRRRFLSRSGVKDVGNV
jgi:hypothetical protein